jgi:hypothetical protein
MSEWFGERGDRERLNLESVKFLADNIIDCDIYSSKHDKNVVGKIIGINSDVGWITASFISSYNISDINMYTSLSISYGCESLSAGVAKKARNVRINEITKVYIADLDYVERPLNSNNENIGMKIDIDY